MSTDSITDDIRRIRHDLAARLNNDLDAILSGIRGREALDDRAYVSLPPRRTSANQDEPRRAPARQIGAE